jgi:hypothetical protein
METGRIKTINCVVLEPAVYVSAIYLAHIEMQLFTCQNDTGVKYQVIYLPGP